jgi:hypothetical protein
VKKPRIVYAERGLVTAFVGTPLEGRAKIGYIRVGAPAGAPMLTKDQARYDARLRGAVAVFRRIP